MSDFDPKAYLAKKSEDDFDPKAYLGGPESAPEKHKAPVPTGPGYGDAALAGVQNLGAFGWGDEIGGAMQGGLAKLTGTGDFGETYRHARDENRAESKAAKAAHPAAYYAAGIPAAVAASLAIPVAKAAQGASLGARALYSAANGAALGGLNAAGDSDADSIGGVAKDAGKGALLGGAVGGALPVGWAGLRGLFGGAAAPLESVAIGQGRKVLTNGADSLSKRNPLRDEAVAEAIRSGGIKPFGNTASTLKRLEGLTEEQGARYGDIIDKLAGRGVRGPKAEELAQKMLSAADELEPNTMNDALPELYRSAAGKIRGKVGNPASPRIGLVQNESLKRSAQDIAKYGRFEETPANEIHRDIASMLRQGSEDAIDEQASASGSPELQDLASKFVPVKQKLGRLLEAEAAATRGAARGAQRNHFGLKDVAAAASAIASGHPELAPVAAVGSNFLNNRVPSAVASYGLRAADALRESDAPSGAAARIADFISSLKNDSEPIFLDGGSISRGEGGPLAPTASEEEPVDRPRFPAIRKKFSGRR